MAAQTKQLIQFTRHVRGHRYGETLRATAAELEAYDKDSYRFITDAKQLAGSPGGVPAASPDVKTVTVPRR